jgi:hypothetical protein
MQSGGSGGTVSADEDAPGALVRAETQAAVETVPKVVRGSMSKWFCE